MTPICMYFYGFYVLFDFKKFPFDAATGDQLKSLASWSGDWFLDEMYSTSGSVIQYTRLLFESCVVILFMYL